MPETSSHKYCWRCKETKPAESFYTHRTRGLTSECKQCSREVTKNFRKTPAGMACRARERVKYAKTEHGKKALYDGMKRFRRRNPDKIKAVNYINDRVRNGTIQRPSNCSRCQSTDRQIEAHHHKGYSPEHWLNVVWVCTSCHKQIHREMLK